MYSTTPTNLCVTIAGQAMNELYFEKVYEKIVFENYSWYFVEQKSV